MKEKEIEEQLQTARKERETEFMIGLDELLKKYNCTIDFVETRVNGKLANMAMNVRAL